MEPHSGVGAGTPSPMKLKPDMFKIAVASPMETWTMIGAREFGSTYLIMSRMSPAPVALAASMYSWFLTVMTADLATLAKAGMLPRPMAIIRFDMELPRAATTEIPRSRLGTAMKISMIRMSTLSTTPL